MDCHASFRTYVATTAVATSDYHSGNSAHLRVFQKDRLLLKKRNRMDNVDGYEAMASDGSAGFVPDAVLSDLQPASLSYRVRHRYLITERYILTSDMY